MSNKYTYSVPFTEEEIFNSYYHENMSQKEIAIKFGTTQKVVWKAMKNMGLTARKAYKRDQKGDKNSSWKGGRILNGIQTRCTRFSSSGYWYVRKPDHPNATQNGYVAEHRLVMEEKIGRYLQKGECVHHIDMDKKNNKIENLALCDSKLHREFHLQLEHIAIIMYKNGKVVFDKEQNKYILKD